MRVLFTALTLALLAGCSTGQMHYSTYDVNRDGVMDFICPGMEYDTERGKHYSWRAKGSQECREQRSSS